MTEQTKIIAKHGNIASALAAAQAQMGKALKASSNPHFKSKYADLASVMDACMEALSTHGIAVIQPTGEDEFGRFVETVLIHESGNELRCKVPLIIGKNDMQGYGAALTYARRYGLMSMAGVAPADDDDGNHNAAGGNPIAQGVRDAWTNGVLDSLPENASARDRAEAFAKAICADFDVKKLETLDGRWSRHSDVIERLKRFKDLHTMVVDAFETRKNEITEQA